MSCEIRRVNVKALIDVLFCIHQELKALLDASNEGVIYWSFGSMSRIETIPSETLAQIFQAISGLSQTVLIKMNRGMLSRNLTVPDNVYTMQWIPQYATLCKYTVSLYNSLSTAVCISV